MENKLSRRQFLRLLWFGLVDLILLAIGGIVYSALIEPGWYRVETVRLTLRRLPKSFSGIRIAQISDIHMGGWMDRERLQRVVDLLLEQKPELILITGDFLTGHGFGSSHRQAVGDLLEVLAPLANTVPTFAVLGNHDYWTDAQAVREMLAACGITDLSNAVFTLTRDDSNLHLCGVDDVWAGDVKLDEVITRLKDDSPAILLAHEPDFADTSAATGKFDLQVSGHSHGGQVVLPFVGPPILPYLGNKYPAGLYQLGAMAQYTNRGVGMLSPPVRFNCPPEITIFILESPG
jgi:predicted MPP superfamily phosphohydrolase